MALAPRLPPGSIFARDFKVIDLLAEGGMGAVYRVEQLSTRKMRALKLLATRLAADPKGRERFVREATVGASIDSEHVVEIIGAGIDEQTGRPWLAMELLDGADLGAVQEHHGTLTPGQLREVVGQLCHGLQAAHRAGVVHRDLKPANVFVARSRRAGVPFTIKILDFGIAKVVQESGTGTETDTVGSPLWMSPEQLDAQRPSPATDVWALGLVAFWALTGKHYWRSAHAEASTVQALFVEQLFKPLDSATMRARELGGVVETLPEGFDAWFLRCLERDPTRRFTDAARAGEALQALLPADPESAARLLPDQVLPPSTGRTEPQHRTAAATGSEATLMGDPTGWGASAVVPGSELAAARSAYEADATRADPMPLGADLSRGPVPGMGAPAKARSRTSPVTVAISVALVVAVLLGGAFMVWKRREARTEPRAQTPEAETVEAVDLGGGEPKLGEGSTGDAPAEAASGDTSAPLEAAEPGPDLGGTPEAVSPALDLVVPLRQQLDERAHDIEFMGWSTAGHRFALRVEHRDDKKGEHDRLELIQVHDALTGVMVESFLVSRDAGPSIKSYLRLSRAEAEARPRADWPARRDALGIVDGKPRRTSPQGSSLALEVGDVPAGTSLATPPSQLGGAFRWSSLGAATESGSMRVAPLLTIWLEQDGQRWSLVEKNVPFTLDRLRVRPVPPGESIEVAGRMLAHWSPDGHRVLMLIEIDVRPGGSDEASRYRGWFLRAAGPQIRIVEAGSGQARAREVALQLEAAGLVPARIALREPAEGRSRLVLARGVEGLTPVAERIRAELPWLTPPERERIRGWADVKIVLGHDAMGQ